MAKTKSNRNKHRRRDAGNWSNADHENRMATRIASIQKKRDRKQRALLEQEEQQNDGQQQQQPLEQYDDKPPAAKKLKHEQPLHQKRNKNYRNKHARLAQHVPENTYKHTHLAHDGYEQIESSKLRLATSQIQRQVTALKERLEEWDPVEEAKLAKAEAEGLVDETSMEHKLKLHAEHRKEDAMARAKAQSEVVLLHAKHGVNSSFHRRKHNLKKHARPGPETWKLKGAARPAWEVYDFDTRYQDPHMKAHEDANARARRVKNIMRLCKGRFALDDDEMDETNNSNEDDNSKKLFPTPQPLCRRYLSLLTQLGSLQLERKNYSSARKAFLEVLELEGTDWPYSITNARNQLMNMYMSTNRPASARKLWERLDNDGSAWIRYSAALIEYVSWNLLQEEGSTAESAERLLAKAIRGNVYVAFFLGWPQMFEKAMEYTEELVERGDSPSGSILEAIEYGCSVNEDKGLGMWAGTDGSLEWVRSVILKVLNSDDENGDANPEDKLVKADLMIWERKLATEEEDYERERNEKEQMKANEETNESDNEESSYREEDDEEEPDSLMYAGMFRTAMDWLQDAGEFLQAPTYDFISSEDNADEKDEAKDMTANQTGNEHGLDGSDKSGSGTDDSSESEE